MSAFSAAENEAVLYTSSDVTFAQMAASDDDDAVVEDKGVGTLFVTSSRIVWVGSDATLEFPATALMMHAVSREGVESFARPCMYCQLDESHGLPAECYFAPITGESLDAIFRYFSQTALMNPPPEEQEEGGGVLGMDGFDGFYGEVDNEMVSGDDGSDVPQHLHGAVPSTEEHAAMLAHLDSILQVPHHLQHPEVGQFDGAD